MTNTNKSFNTTIQSANIILDLGKECQLQGIIYGDELIKQANIIIANAGNNNATNVDGKEGGL